ncbi:hypothetical protein C8R47DRAFT_719494 [Mycena vitilis]|nr:hypothetical protein C8R47DRAFT_719494 [Mycena vitilis]
MLEKLRPVAGSLYNDLDGGGECMPGTRAGVLAALMTWATERDGPSVYFLTGMAGAGKSAIARSFAKLLDSHALLGASFFCSRASETRSNVAGIIPSVAFSLAYHSKHFADAIIGAIRGAPGVSFHHRAPLFQFTTLLLPLSHVQPDDHQTSVVIIDALDECAGLNVARDLLGVVLRFNSHSTSGSRLKFFITSRPEPLIETAFASELLARRLRLHDVEEDFVSADVETYLRRSLRDVARRVNAPEWPTPLETTELIRRTGKLFIFAFTVVQYLSPHQLSRAEVQTRLRNILTSPPTKIQTAAIDALYGQILDAAWEGKESSEIISRQRALTTLICLRESLSIFAICGLLKEDPEDLGLLLADFHSVIDMPRSNHSPVLIFHASLPDYLTDTRRSANNALNAQAHHAVLAFQCINCMNSLLSENMCGIALSDSLSQITETVLDTSIPTHLRYASTYWATHISMIPPGTLDTDIYPELRKWVTTHMLHWLECMSLMGKMHLVSKSLQDASVFAMGQNWDDITSLLNETRRMLPQIFEFATIYPLEIYHSALEWLPMDSLLRSTYPIGKPRSVVAGLDQRWANCQQILAHGTSCHCMALLDDARVVSGAENNAYIWSLETGQIQKQLRGHYDSVASVAYSRSSNCIATGSSDQTIRLWNAVTGETERELLGHSHAVLSVTFSPDGSRLASASQDTTIRIWNIKTGETDRQLQTHSSYVWCVVFSPDGGRLLSASGGSTDNNSIRLWNAQSGEMVWNADSSSSSVVAFSSNGRYIAAALQSDNVISLWNATNGKHDRDLVGHSHWVRSLAFSPDARMLASGSLDQSIRVWNTESTETIDILLGHSGLVNSLAFTPDGSRIVSSAVDGTIRVWNVNTGHIGRASAWVWSVGFIPHSEAVFSRLGDGRVQIWDAQSGNREQEFAEATTTFSTVSIPTYDPFRDPNLADVHCQLAQTRDYISLHPDSDPKHKRLWIWSDYRHGISASAFEVSKACLGYNSGRVVIVDMA